MQVNQGSQIKTIKVNVIPADIDLLDSTPIIIFNNNSGVIIPFFTLIQVTIYAPTSTRVDFIDSLILKNGNPDPIGLLNPAGSQLIYNNIYNFLLGYNGSIYGNQWQNGGDYIYLSATTSGTITTVGTEGIYVYINYMQFKYY